MCYRSSRMVASHWMRSGLERSVATGVRSNIHYLHHLALHIIFSFLSVSIPLFLRVFFFNSGFLSRKEEVIVGPHVKLHHVIDCLSVAMQCSNLKGAEGCTYQMAIKTRRDVGHGSLLHL